MIHKENFKKGIQSFINLNKLDQQPSKQKKQQNKSKRTVLFCNHHHTIESKVDLDEKQYLKFRHLVVYHHQHVSTFSPVQSGHSELGHYAIRNRISIILIVKSLN